MQRIAALAAAFCLLLSWLPERLAQPGLSNVVQCSIGAPAGRLEVPATCVWPNQIDAGAELHIIGSRAGRIESTSSATPSIFAPASPRAAAGSLDKGK